MVRPLAFVVLFLVAASPGLAAGALDWPQWRGSQRDAVWREEGIVDRLPEEGLDFTWRVPCGLGYAGPAVADGRVYLFEYDKTSGEITDNPGGRDRLTGKERLRCLDSVTGNELWRHEYERDYHLSYPSGPRCTPTVDGERVYLLGAQGDLRCLKSADGALVWKKHFETDYGAPTPMWGHSAHPLVIGDTLYCLVGGEGSVAVAFDKHTGEEKWRALSTPSLEHECGYCPPTRINVGGNDQVVAFTPEEVAGLDPATGEVFWSVPITPAYGMSIAQPIKTAAAQLLVSGYGGVSVCLELPADKGEARVVWSGKAKTSFSAANASPVKDYVAGVIYGQDANGSSVVAINASTGERLWQTQKPALNVDRRSRDRHGTAFLIRQGQTDRYWIAAETGHLVHARLSPTGYEELGRAEIIEPTGDAFGRAVWWSHPAFAERSVFARNDKEIVRVNLAAE